jgi:tRNA-dihydrouridine synthase A
MQAPIQDVPCISIAPMMECTDRHFRYFLRLISRHVLLYTEMVHAEAVMRGDREFLIGFDPSEHPIALQLGGSDPEQLKEAAKIAEDWGYDEINLNVGCPSSRVQDGNFGACLMANPALVADLIAAMQSVVSIPVTCKHRIGIDGLEAYDDLANFVETVSSVGCTRFTVHARIAILGGLSPKQNRTIPPLRYEDVYRLKREFPHLFVEINGGITTLDEVEEHLKYVDAVMIGRAAYNDPFLFAEADQRFFGSEEPVTTREAVLEQMIPYFAHWTETKGQPLGRMTRHMMGLWKGEKGARWWRRHVNNTFHDSDGEAMVRSFLALMSEAA